MRADLCGRCAAMKAATHEVRKVAGAAESGQIVYLPIGALHPHPQNPRKDLGDLTELANSIRAKGVLQNLTVVPLVDVDPDATIDTGDGHYTVIFGNRRLAAAALAGLEKVPCVIAHMDEKAQVQTMLLENMQRSDLTVYEQAQGFQLMMDLGATVEEIAQQTGFSESTVRRRVKLTELDQGTLKDVATRQISMGDLDQLAKIENIRVRNKVLQDIGTNNFNHSFNQAMNEQLVRKNRPAVKQWLKKIGAIAIPEKDRYSNKYDTYQGCPYYVFLVSWDEEKLPKRWKEPVYYVLDGDSLRLLAKAKKAKPKKVSPAEKARKEAIDAAWKALDAAAKTAYDLRREFIAGVAMGKKNRESILTGAVYAALLAAVDGNWMERSEVAAALGEDLTDFHQRMEKAWAAYAKVSPKDMAKLVYAFFHDGARVPCLATGGRWEFPVFARSVKLEILYNWLGELGYVVSDEETALLNGTHEAYKQPEGGEPSAG